MHKEKAFTLWRSYLGYADVRNGILKHYIGDNDIHFHPIIYDYHTPRKDFKNFLLNDLQKIKAKYVVFSANNHALTNEYGTGETHYMSFILEGNVLYCVEPSRNSDGTSLYVASAINYVIKTLKNTNIKTEYVNVYPDAPQVDFTDVYCQTWSLLIVIEFFKNNKSVIIDPNEKAGILLNFFKEILDISFTNDKGITVKIKDDFCYQNNNKRIHKYIKELREEDI